MRGKVDQSESESIQAPDNIFVVVDWLQWFQEPITALVGLVTFPVGTGSSASEAASPAFALLHIVGVWM